MTLMPDTHAIAYVITWMTFYCFYELFSLIKVFVENHGLLSGIDIVAYSFNQPLKLCWIQMQIGGAYTMVQHMHAGLLVPELKMSLI